MTPAHAEAIAALNAVRDACQQHHDDEALLIDPAWVIRALRFCVRKPMDSAVKSRAESAVAALEAEA